MSVRWRQVRPSTRPREMRCGTSAAGREPNSHSIRGRGNPGEGGGRLLVSRRGETGRGLGVEWFGGAETDGHWGQTGGKGPGVTSAVRDRSCGEYVTFSVIHVSLFNLNLKSD